MQVVLLCGGKGTRLNEKTESIPKPLIKIGGKPILWHIMKIYSTYGHKDFILLLGYKGSMIKEYFERNSVPEWDIKFVDTGLNASKSERIMKIKHLIKDTNFILSYGDDVSDLDINKVIDFHKKNKKIVTITSVNPESEYGIIEINNKYEIKSFKEKPKLPFWINGGYMVVNIKLFDILKKGELEKEVFGYLAASRQIVAYKYEGFWKSMNTLKENIELNELWESGNAPWKVWKSGDNNG